MNLNIVFQDEAMMVVDKPPGLVTTPSDTQTTETLADILQKEYGIDLERGGIVHRLDKDTSGLILVAKTPQALESLQVQFKERTVKKEYLALVHGHMEKGGVVDAPIGRNPENREKFTVLEHSDTAREAVTEYKPIGKYQIPSTKFQSIFNDLNKIQTRKLEKMNYNQFTLVACQPKTGRTHQIRVHLKHIGFPIVADATYGGRKVYRLDHRWVPRQFLHAAKIKFSHPVTGKAMELTSPLPEDLEKALWTMSSYN